MGVGVCACREWVVGRRWGGHGTQAVWGGQAWNRGGNVCRFAQEMSPAGKVARGGAWWRSEATRQVERVESNGNRSRLREEAVR